METIQGIVTRCLSVPHLPDTQAVLVAAAKSAAPKLKALGLRVVSPVPCRTLPRETKEHTDMLLCHTGGDTVFLSADQPGPAQALQNAGFTVFPVPQPGAHYPSDVSLNVLVGRDHILGNLQYAEKSLLSHCALAGKRPITVKQGYAKCSVCPITENAFITDDAGIARALEKLGKDVLLIEKGDVYLSDRHYGLIGGAAGKLAPDTIAFNGSLYCHRDGENIRAFLFNYGIRPIELFKGRLVDIGGILPLTEKNDGESRY